MQKLSGTFTSYRIEEGTTLQTSSGYCRASVWYHKTVPGIREGFNYILTKKGIARAGSDVGFMFIAYNLRRIGNILTMEVLKEYLRILVSSIFGFLPSAGSI